MCIIMSKPVNVAFPEESILKNCWDNNPDMGGFMYAMDGKVHIYKGYDTWEKFISALNWARKKTGDNVAYVCHFRISTQGYDTACCQPFPLSGKMKNLKRHHTEANIGVAHNGILSLTSDGAKDYSDTMKFITDYLVNIIRSYDWYNDERTLKLIENLINGSRFSILDKNGHCQLMGKGWVEDGGCSYSNSTYSYKQVSYYNGKGGESGIARSAWYDDDYWGDYYYDYQKKQWVSVWEKDDNKTPSTAPIVEGYETPSLDPYEKYWNDATGKYDFDENNCPNAKEDDDGYCGMCSNFRRCSYVASCTK